MNTLTHLIAASAMLARKDAPARNRAIIAGALIPDLSIYVMSVWAIAAGQMNETLWQVTYWQEPWQTLGALTNSVPLAIIMLGIGLWRRASWLWALAGAMLIHAALDLPLHADDAHRHFWPLTDWRYHSPISYWDKDHYGLWGGLLDCSVLFASIAALWMRFKARSVRLLLAALSALGIAYVGALIAMA